MIWVSPVFAQAPRLEIATISELPIWRTITVGTHRNVDTIRGALDEAGIAIGDSADEILGRPAFAFSPTPRTLNLVVLTVAELGFGGDGAALAELHACAIRLGLDLCPEEVGPQLRFDYLNQPAGEFLHVAMKPQRMYHGELVDLTLANDGVRLSLLGGDGRPDTVLPRSAKLVFVRPHAPQLSSR